jgi:hypothetical protein
LTIELTIPSIDIEWTRDNIFIAYTILSYIAMLIIIKLGKDSSVGRVVFGPDNSTRFFCWILSPLFFIFSGVAVILLGIYKIFVFITK